MREPQEKVAVMEGAQSKKNQGSGARLIWPGAVVLGFLLLASLTAYTLVQLNRVNAHLATLEWLSALNSETSTHDVLMPEVGSIQFTRRGHSISFSSVRYTPDGLALAGRIGNPTGLWVQTLTLTFTAYRPFSLQHDQFVSNAGSGPKQFLGMGLVWPIEIGKGQSGTISALAPGTQQDFKVTVPNVKQAQDGFVLAISFSGERYAYAQ